MPTIHCSRLPRIMACPASLSEADIQIYSESGPPAWMGTAVHALLAEHLRTGRDPDAHEIDTAAHQHSVEAEELRILYYMGRDIWIAYKSIISVRTIETQMSSQVGEIELVGTADLLGEYVDDDDEKTLVVWDWKSGRLDSDYTDQLKGYALMALRACPEYNKIKIFTAWIRTREVDIADFTRDEAEEWSDKLATVCKRQTEYCVGEGTCTYCPIATTCPAYRAEMGQIISLVSANLTPETAIVDMDPITTAACYSQVVMLEKWAGHAKQVIRALVRTHGSLPTPDGGHLELTEEQRATLDPERALPVIQEYLGTDPNAYMSAIKISKGGVEKLVRAAAPKGTTKKAAVERFRDDLGVAGALSYTTITKLVKRK